MQPTADDFRALARSSPWRWRTLHFRHRSDYAGTCEAWVRRPGELLVRKAGEHDTYASGLPYGVATTRVWVSDDPAFVPPPEPPRRVPQEVAPPLRADGLVAERPDDGWIDYDDPMHGNYSWVAMLDPVELSHHVDVSDLRVDDIAGRPVWRADLRARAGYQPRCGGNCCELLYSEAGLLADFSSRADVPESWRGREYPDHYDVALDAETGVVVRCQPVGGPHDSPWLENDILEVDIDQDGVFQPWENAE